MKPFFQYWLPQEALVDGTVEEHLQNTLREWSGKWFVRTHSYSVEVKPRSAVSVEEVDVSLSWQNKDAALCAYMRSDAVNSLGSLLLGQNMKTGRINPAVMQTLTGVVRHFTDDLNDVMKALFEIPSTLELSLEQTIQHVSASDYILTIKQNGQDIGLVYGLAHNYLVMARKGLVKAPSRHINFDSMENALDGQTIAVGACVGDGSISLEEAQNIAVGDVLVLDSLTEGAIKVTINDKIVPGLKCRLTQAKNGKALKLTEITMDDNRE